MGFLTNKIERSEIKPGDHIYAYRTVFAYSHHGIYVGGNKVVHFTRDSDKTSTGFTSFSSYESICQTPSLCTYADCGFRQQPGSGVVFSCLDCFLKSGSLYLFEYGVSAAAFCAKPRGGTCTTAMSDDPDTVIYRAMFLLHNGFGNYDVFENNCEDFALYCKTGLLVDDKKTGRVKSGQVLSVFGAAPIAGLVSFSLKFFMPNPLAAAASAGVYCYGRYTSDIGVRSDVVKVSVDDLALKWCSMDDLKRDSQETESGRGRNG